MNGFSFEAKAKQSLVSEALIARGIPKPAASVSFFQGDYQEMKLRDADVVFCYSTTWDSVRVLFILGIGSASIPPLSRLVCRRKRDVSFMS